MTDRLSTIFSHQLELTTKFRAIQNDNGLLSTPDIPVDPLSREGCLELHKDLHWINLEIAEAIYARPEKRREELADVMHFLAEFCHVAGIGPDIVPGNENNDSKDDKLDILVNASTEDPFVFPDFEANARFTILAVLRVADLLKNKPWKQSLKGDWNGADFQDRVRAMFYWYGATVRTAGMTAQDLFDAYMGKKSENQQRIEAGV